MMGPRSGQIGMQIVDVEMMIQETRLLRKISKMVSLDLSMSCLRTITHRTGVHR